MAATRKNSPTTAEATAIRRMRLEGAKNAEIGYFLGYSTSTVRNYAKGIAHPLNHGKNVPGGRLAK